MGDNPGVTIFWIIVFVIVFVIYFLPSLIAKRKNKRNKNAIALLNLFLGWTFIGWVVALVWAATEERIDIIELNNPVNEEQLRNKTPH